MQIADEDRLIRVREAAEYLGVSASHLNKLRCWGGGPEFIRIGVNRGAIRYRVADLRTWVESKRRRSTSDAA